MDENTQVLEKSKAVTISSITDSYREPVPFIRLRGRWLEKLGWSVGTKVLVSAGTDKITLRKKYVQKNVGQWG